MCHTHGRSGRTARGGRGAAQGQHLFLARVQERTDTKANATFCTTEKLAPMADTVNCSVSTYDSASKRMLSICRTKLSPHPPCFLEVRSTYNGKLEHREAPRGFSAHRRESPRPMDYNERTSSQPAWLPERPRGDGVYRMGSSDHRRLEVRPPAWAVAAQVGQIVTSSKEYDWTLCSGGPGDASGGSAGERGGASYGRRAVATAKWAAMQISGVGKGLNKTQSSDTHGQRVAQSQIYRLSREQLQGSL